MRCQLPSAGSRHSTASGTPVPTCFPCTLPPKVYTVGPRYAHAEARTSPVVDGTVTRAADGKELRFPVLLSPQEKEVARAVCLAFGQKVCGFDLLRSAEKGRSFVCDVNGFSMVKHSFKYYDDAAGILRSLILSAVAPHRLTALPPPPPSAGPGGMTPTPTSAEKTTSSMGRGTARPRSAGAKRTPAIQPCASARERP